MQENEKHWPACSPCVPGLDISQIGEFKITCTFATRARQTYLTVRLLHCQWMISTDAVTLCPLKLVWTCDVWPDECSPRWSQFVDRFESQIVHYSFLLFLLAFCS